MAETTNITVAVPTAELALAEKLFCEAFGLAVTAANAKAAAAKVLTRFAKEQAVREEQAVAEAAFVKATEEAAKAKAPTLE